mmetsp:Transcript_11098/g.22755  ORF Transcript_11098/g.22755 Transcript_11098/m.22755 type:complete len:122 (-) Transcript_11098:1194-1559(-)
MGRAQMIESNILPLSPLRRNPVHVYCKNTSVRYPQFQCNVQFKRCSCVEKQYRDYLRYGLSNPNTLKSTCIVLPSINNSATASPVAGPFSIPQQPCPAATKAPLTPGTSPIKGTPSEVLGK